jgi:hypothetical protein
VSFYWGNPSFRERVLDDRRRRYQEDPAYRAAQLERSKSARSKDSKPAKPRSPNHPRIFEIGGFPVLMVGLGAAAEKVGLSKKGFRTLDDDGVIPRNRLIDSLGRRWYPSDYVDWLVPHLAEQSKKREPKWILKERVEHAWKLSTTTKIGDMRA